jgi:hypothetical protein
MVEAANSLATLSADHCIMRAAHMRSRATAKGSLVEEVNSAFQEVVRRDRQARREKGALAPQGQNWVIRWRVC